MRAVSGPILALLMLSGCAIPASEAPNTQPVTTGQALAQLACPLRIAEAHAWVNLMPGPARTTRDLQVDVRLADASDTAVLIRSPASTGEILVLELRTAPAAPIAGRVGYREPAPEHLYGRVSFYCRGAEIFSLSGVEQVY